MIPHLTIYAHCHRSMPAQEVVFHLCSEAESKWVEVGVAGDVVQLTGGLSEIRVCLYLKGVVLAASPRGR